MYSISGSSSLQRWSTALGICAGIILAGLLLGLWSAGAWDYFPLKFFIK